MAVQPIQAPAGFVPVQALSFGGIGGTATAVDGDNPLPVATRLGAAGTAPLAGTAAASGTVGPFAPQLGRPVWLTLSGSWTGTVQLMRSEDGGATLLPLTLAGAPWGSFTANCNEPVAEETVAGATYHLALTLGSGSVTYRVAQ